MPDLLKLPLRAVDLGTRPARFVIGKLLELRHADDDQATAPPAQQGPTPAAQAPQSAPREPRAATKPAPSVKAARRATRHEPTKGQAAAIREQQREEEWGDGDGPGAEVTIDPAVQALADKP